MRMKKRLILSLLLAIFHLSLPSVAALGEVWTQKPELSGLITEVSEGSIMITDAESGPVLLSVDTETILEGILGGTPLEVGMYVFAKYTGILTNTEPPQAHADRLGCYALKGIVAETTNKDLLLAGDELFSEALVHLESNMPQAFMGVPITVYYNGTMTMSLPPQVTANHLVVPVLSGKVKGMNTDNLSLVTEDQQEYTIHFNGKTLVPTSWYSEGLEGKDIMVYYDGTIRDQNALISLKIKIPAVMGTSVALEEIALENNIPSADENAPPESFTTAPTEDSGLGSTPSPIITLPPVASETDIIPSTLVPPKNTGMDEDPNSMPEAPHGG